MRGPLDFETDSSPRYICLRIVFLIDGVVAVVVPFVRCFGFGHAIPGRIWLDILGSVSWT